MILQNKRSFYFLFFWFAPVGALQEVSYTHSNQKVVGSSRAENRLSRAALRDVFELNKDSQLPANHLHAISEVFTIMAMNYYYRW